MKKIVSIGLIVLFALTTSVSAQQEPNDASGDVRYIKDDLFTFMHAGPGRNYRILGSIQAGSKITVLQMSEDNDFAEVIDDSQRTGWVEAQYITRNSSIREQLPELREALALAQQTQAQLEAESGRLNQQLAEVTSKNSQLNNQLSTLIEKNVEIQRSLDQQDQSAQMEWLIRGGIIGLVGTILGVIIAYLPKKRRREDQWM